MRPPDFISRGGSDRGFRLHLHHSSSASALAGGGSGLVSRLRLPFRLDVGAYLHEIRGKA